MKTDERKITHFLFAAFLLAGAFWGFSVFTNAPASAATYSFYGSFGTCPVTSSACVIITATTTTGGNFVEFTISSYYISSEMDWRSMCRRAIYSGLGPGKVTFEDGSWYGSNDTDTVSSWRASIGCGTGETSSGIGDATVQVYAGTGLWEPGSVSFYVPFGGNPPEVCLDMGWSVSGKTDSQHICATKTGTSDGGGVSRMSVTKISPSSQEVTTNLGSFLTFESLFKWALDPAYYRFDVFDNSGNMIETTSWNPLTGGVFSEQKSATFRFPVVGDYNVCATGIEGSPGEATTGDVSDCWTVTVMQPAVDLKANGSDGPLDIVAGESVLLEWNANGIPNGYQCFSDASMKVTGWSGGITRDLSGSFRTPPLFSSTTFNVECRIVVQPPTAPSNLSATTTHDASGNPLVNILGWVDNSNNEDDFKVERSVGNTSSFTSIGNAGPNVTIFSDGNIQVDTTYYYRVRACNAAGCSSYSNVFSITPTTVVGNKECYGSSIACFGNCTASCLPDSTGEGDCFIFECSGDNTGANCSTYALYPNPRSITAAKRYNVSEFEGATGWAITKRPDNCGNPSEPFSGTGDPSNVTLYAANADCPENVLTTVHDPLTPGEKFTYNVIFSSGGPLNELTASFVCALPPSVPAAPSNLSEEKIFDQFGELVAIDLSWTDNSNNESFFEVERAEGDRAAFLRIGTSTADNTFFEDREISKKINYYYRVRACNTNGCSDYSNTVTVPPVFLKQPILPSSIASFARFLKSSIGKIAGLLNIATSQAQPEQPYGDKVVVNVIKMSVDLTANPSVGDAPLDVELTAQVSGAPPPYNYSYDFDNDGNIDVEHLNVSSTTDSAITTYTTSSVAKVTVTGGGQTASDTATINIRGFWFKIRKFFEF